MTANQTTFTVPNDFDPDAMLEDAFSIIYDDPVTVKIRFSPESVRYIRERQWAKEQTIVDNPDGSVILELKTSGWFDVKRWILSFGAEAEVMEPEELRTEICAELSAAQRCYVK